MLKAPGNPTTGGGAGDVSGPASSVDNAIARFGGTTGKLIQGYTANSPTINDTGEMSIGYSAATTPPLSVTGGASGTDLIRLIRPTTGLTYGWSLAGGGLAFNDVTAGFIPCNIFADVGVNQVYLGQKLKTIADTRPSLLSATTFGTTAGTDVAGNDLRIQGGLGTGSGLSGGISFRTGDPLASGTTTQTSTEKLRLGADGKITVLGTNTAAGTTGARTINRASGTVNFAAGATSLVVTNALCTTASIVFATVRTNDVTAVIKNVVPAAGSFTINLASAATAETSVGFLIIN
jgi:hypothetical protein